MRYPIRYSCPDKLAAMPVRWTSRPCSGNDNVADEIAQDSEKVSQVVPVRNHPKATFRTRNGSDSPTVELLGVRHRPCAPLDTCVVAHSGDAVGWAA